MLGLALYSGNLASNVDDPSAAFNLSISDLSFKCYMMDTGLLISLAYKDRPYLDNEIYKNILLDKLHVNEGMIVENIVAQSLRSNGHNTYFYKETDKDKKKTEIEIVFLVRRDSKVIPVEVKSGDNFSLKSIIKLKEKFGKRIGEGIVLHHGEVMRKDGFSYYPYYMASFL